jgi:hypothetical protein
VKRFPGVIGYIDGTHTNNFPTKRGEKGLCESQTLSFNQHSSHLQQWMLEANNFDLNVSVKDE